MESAAASCRASSSPEVGFDVIRHPDGHSGPRDSQQRHSITLIYLVALAALQAAFFLTAHAPASRRIVSVCLFGITLAEWWQPWLFGAKRNAAIWTLATLCVANYVAFASLGGLPVELRLWQAMVILGYAGAALAGLACVLRILPERRAFVVALTGALGLLIIEMALGTRQGKFLWSGGVALVAASHLPVMDGSTPASGTIAWSDYPEDPRGYFEDPKTWRASWRVDINDVSAASTLEFPANRAEALRAVVRRGGPRKPWYVQIAQAGTSLKQGERYSLSFRARAAVPGTLYVAAGRGRAPWTAIGLYQAVTVDSEWRHVQFQFTPTASDSSAKLYFDVGLVQDTVELTRITLRHSATGERVVPLARHRHTVRYRFSQLGCRGAEMDGTPRAGVRRILVVGGASSLGMGVHEEDTFASRLQDRLNRPADSSLPSRKVEVINCALPGSDVIAWIASVKRLVAEHAPALVLFTVGVDDEIRWRPSSSAADAELPRMLDRLLLSWNLVHGAWVTSQERRSGGRMMISNAAEMTTLRTAIQPAELVLMALRTSEDRAWSESMPSLGRTARSLGIPLLDVGPALLARHSPASLVVDAELQRHPNDIAHALAADTLGVFLQTRRHVSFP